MRKVTGLVLLPILVLLVSTLTTGCGALERVTEAHAQADRANFEAVADEYVDMSKNAYRQKDDGTYEKWFTDSQAERRETTVATWKRHVEEAEKEAKSAKSEDAEPTPEPEPEPTPEPEPEPTPEPDPSE